MAKKKMRRFKKVDTAPALESPDINDAAFAQETPAQAATAGATGPGALESQSVIIELPVGPPEFDGYVTRHIDIQLDQRQARALRRVFSALHDSAVRLPNGRYVQSSADALRYILEQIAAAAD